MPLPRFDGDLVRDLPATRWVMPFLMPGRNEASVAFRQQVDLERTLPWLEAWGTARGRKVSLFPLVLAAIVRTLHEHPRLNRFVAGHRIYQRRGIWIAFAAKKRLEDGAPLATVKLRFDPAEPFEALVDRLTAGVAEARSDRPSPVDRELALFRRLPGWLFALLVRLVAWLDRRNLAPAFLLRDDPMYCSVFAANLGSIGLDAADHHLYEWGNCPLFVTVGRVHEAVVVRNGRPEVRRVADLRWRFDERVEDGLACALALRRFQALLEDPGSWLGAPGDAPR